MMKKGIMLFLFLILLLPLLPLCANAQDGTRQQDDRVRVLWEYRSPRPGEAFLVKVISEKAIDSIKGRIFSEGISFYEGRSNMVFYGIGGIGLNTRPGKYPLEVNIRYKDGGKEEFLSFLIVKERRFRIQSLVLDERYVHLSSDDLERAEKEREKNKKIFNTITPYRLFSERFGMPLTRNIPTTRFGLRRIINGEKRQPHTGLDLKGRKGTPVHACNSGRVILVKDLFFTGKTIIIDHGLGIHSLYAHLSKTLVREGEMVKKGKLVGLTGNTGRVTGPHLHWSISIRDTPIDPVSLVELNIR